MELERRRREDQSLPRLDPGASEASRPARDFRKESDEIDSQLARSIAVIAERYRARDVINRGGQ
jgi:hypothetical protein